MRGFRSGFILITSVAVNLRIFRSWRRNACGMTRMEHRIVQRGSCRFHVRETRTVSRSVRIRSVEGIVMVRTEQGRMDEWIRLRGMHH